MQINHLLKQIEKTADLMQETGEAMIEAWDCQKVQIKGWQMIGASAIAREWIVEIKKEAVDKVCKSGG